MIIKLYTTICGANIESKINIVRRINACKKNFTCPCPCPFHHFLSFLNNPGHGTS